MKKPELILNLIAIPVDALMLILAAVFSFYARWTFQSVIGPVLYDLQISSFLSQVAQIVPGMLIIFAIVGLYNIKGPRKFSREVGKIVLGVSAALFFIIILFFFNRELFPSRFIVLATWGLAIFMVIFGRVILKFAQNIIFRFGYGLHNLVLITGKTSESKTIEHEFSHPKLGTKIVDRIPFDERVFEKLQTLFKAGQIDEIMQTESSFDQAENYELVQFARKRGLRFTYVPNLFEVQKNIIEIDGLNGIPLISLKNTPLEGWGSVQKRIFDIVVSLICILITLPLQLVIAILIKIDSRGPVIYAAKRGSRNTDFNFYKFRSMYSHLSVGEGYGGPEAEQLWHALRQSNDRGGAEGAVSKFKNDPRVTKFGRFLRKSKLDELPQFYNVLKGDMSLVGPRPHVLPELEKYKDIYPRVLSIQPGIFGLSQLAIIKVPLLPFEEEMRLNMYYIENWSLWMDIGILVKCFFALVLAKKPNEDF
jgi:exopolysaccharide biosynthesis polyprenyl glycosylphosphotransferase